MNHTEKRRFLIRELLNEQAQYRTMEIPNDTQEQKGLLRALMNIRRPREISSQTQEIQDGYLQEELAKKTITDIHDLTSLQPGVYLWQGDITTLKCDAIVNAANSGMTGCYVPNHRCIDNAIHTFAGMQKAMLWMNGLPGKKHM